MARPKYTVTAADVTHAYLYLFDRLRNYGIEFDDGLSVSEATNEFHEAHRTKGKEARAAQINAWCETYLSSAEWKKLKVSIRKRRERMERHNELRTVTISTEAYNLLARLAQRDEVTYSEALEHYLPKLLSVVRGRAKKRG